MPTTTHRVFFQCALGLESLLELELGRLGIACRKLEGGVESRTTLEDLQRACLCSRLVESARVRLKEFEARGFDDLQKQLRALPFRAFRGPGAVSRVEVVCKKSKLWHSGAVAERVGQVLSAHVGWSVVEKPDASEQTQTVHVRIDDNQVQVSLDAGGPRMHRRGYRTNVEQASLRETLAAALTLVTLEPCRPGDVGKLWDPFCGAGTVALEALCWARGLLPGARRVHAFEGWRNFDAAAFSELRTREVERARVEAPLPELRALFSDRSQQALDAAKANAENIGLSAFCDFELGDIEEVAPRAVEQQPATTDGAATRSPAIAVLTNPPYGRRLAEAGATKKLLALAAAHPELRPVVALVGGAAREAIPKDRRALFRTKNGGVPISARSLHSQQSRADPLTP